MSAVEFFIRTHGEDALVALIRSYADGRTDDEAFTAAIGQDVAAFGAAWLADLGAEVPDSARPAAGATRSGAGRLGRWRGAGEQHTAGRRHGRTGHDRHAERGPGRPDRPRGWQRRPADRPAGGARA